MVNIHMLQTKKTQEIVQLKTCTAQTDLELYNLDRLGLEDNREGDKKNKQQEFNEQLLRKKNSIYFTHLP